MKLLALIFLLPMTTYAFTLNNSVGARFKSDKVTVSVARVSDNCNNQGTTADELVGLIQPAIRDFWNTVPTSRLELKDGGFYETTDNNFITGELCLSGSACAGTPIPPVTQIVITCNTNATNFPGGSSLLALALPTGISGRSITGAVIAINAVNGNFGNLSRDRKIAVLAHEIGHAIGLGHSEDSAALMFSTLVPSRSSLGQDDIDGVTYLYPVQLDMFGLGCFGASINTQGPPSSWWPTLLMGLFVALILGRRKRSPQYFSPEL